MLANLTCHQAIVRLELMEIRLLKLHEALDKVVNAVQARVIANALQGIIQSIRHVLLLVSFRFVFREP